MLAEGLEGEGFEPEAETLSPRPGGTCLMWRRLAASVFKALLLSDEQLFLMKEEKTINWK